jgi:hypothetical protein
MDRVLAFNDPEGWLIFCPACETHHLFDKRWKFNGDKKKPTFRPSMLIPTPRCHSFVTDGRIQFLNDSMHKMAGQTLDLPEID